MPSGEQRRPRSAYPPAQPDQGLCCSLTIPLDTTECMKGEQRPGWYFEHAQDNLNLCILRMLEGTFLLDDVHMCIHACICMLRNSLYNLLTYLWDALREKGFSNFLSNLSVCMRGPYARAHVYSSMAEVIPWRTNYVSKQPRFRRDCANAQASLNLCCSYMLQRLFFHERPFYFSYRS